MRINTLVEPNTTGPGMITHIYADETSVYWTPYVSGAGTSPLLRKNSKDGEPQTLAPSASCCLASDEANLYFVEGKNIVSQPLAGGEPRTLVSLSGLVSNLAVTGNRLWVLENVPPRFSSLAKDGTQMRDVEEVQRAVAMVADRNTLFVLDTDGPTGALSLVRLELDGNAGHVAMRAGSVETREMLEQRVADINRTKELTPDAIHYLNSATVVSGMAIDPTHVYWSCHTSTGESELWKAPRTFTAKSTAEQIPVQGMGLGAHALAAFGEHLYFLDMEGPQRVAKSGGRAERFGPRAIALTASARGVFVGALDGSVLAVEEATLH